MLSSLAFRRPFLFADDGTLPLTVTGLPPLVARTGPAPLHSKRFRSLERQDTEEQNLPNKVAKVDLSSSASAPIRKDADPGERVRCDQCGKLFVSIKTFKAHAAKMHPKDKDTAQELQYQQTLQKLIKMKQCFDCKMGFWTQSETKVHFALFHKQPGDKPLIWCGEESCGKFFATEKARQEHINYIHRQTIGFSCTVEGCNERYKTEANLARHVERMHQKAAVPTSPMAPKLWSCRHCHYDFRSRAKRDKHEEKKHPFTIGTCSKCNREKQPLFFLPTDTSGDDNEEKKKVCVNCTEDTLASQKRVVWEDQNFKPVLHDKTRPIAGFDVDRADECPTRPEPIKDADEWMTCFGDTSMYEYLRENPHLGYAHGRIIDNHASIDAPVAMAAPSEEDAAEQPATN